MKKSKSISVSSSSTENNCPETSKPNERSKEESKTVSGSSESHSTFHMNVPEKTRKRKFTWTPGRRAAFEKCILANKKMRECKKDNETISTTKKEEKISKTMDHSRGMEKRKKQKRESSDESSVCSSSSSSSRSSSSSSSNSSEYSSSSEESVPPPPPPKKHRRRVLKSSTTHKIKTTDLKKLISSVRKIKKHVTPRPTRRLKPTQPPPSPPPPSEEEEEEAPLYPRRSYTAPSFHFL